MSEENKEVEKKGANANPQAFDWMLRFNRWKVADHSEVKLAEVREIMGDWAWTGELERGLESTETNENGYEHWQVFIQAPSKIRFSTIHKRLKAHGLDGSYIKKREGTVQGCIDYVRKSGSWADKEKARTRLDGPFTFGKLDLRDQQGKKKTDTDKKESNLKVLSDCLDNGMTPDEILKDPYLRMKSSRALGWMKASYNAIHSHFDPKWKLEDREVDVTYIYGDAGAGKTSWALSGDREDIYVADFITDDATGRADPNAWRHVFDEYLGQSVLVLDDFYSSIPFNYLLHLLDRYPLQLEARNFNRWAGWTKVIITSNIPLAEQYPWISNENGRRASLNRRIHHVLKMVKGQPGTPIDLTSSEEYDDDFI
jgi:hypothetical protein